MALTKSKAILRAIKRDLSARAAALPELKPYALHLDLPGKPDEVYFFYTAFGLVAGLKNSRFREVSEVGIFINRVGAGKARRSLLSRRWNFPRDFRRYLGHANVN